MADPLTVLLDAIWIETKWQIRLALKTHNIRWGDQDSISGRNVFWMSVMEGKE